MFADVSLPVPLDQPFTYELPLTLQHRVKIGCRVLVPFGTRKMTGIVLATHDLPPDVPAKMVLRLMDEDSVLEPQLIALGRWVAAYYCAPLGEVLRGMTPLSGEVRNSKVYSLTDAGRDAARQLLLGNEAEDATLKLLRLLEQRPLSANYLSRKIPEAARALKALQKRQFVHMEDVQADRDPMRASAERLRVSLAAGERLTSEKLAKAERELLSYLELHPGSHNLGELEAAVKNASQAARSLARKKLVRLETEAPAISPYPFKAPPTLNGSQRLAFAAIHRSIQEKTFQTFLLYGVTGSGKTEVYLRAIEATLAEGRSALLLVPEIALTPAMAGQFFHRFGDQVAILHSAFHDAERAEQWRRIRSGSAGVVVGTRSGVFAPIQNPGLIIVDEEHDQSYKQQETPRYNGRDVAIVRAQAAGATVVLGSATPSLESRHNVDRGKYVLLELPDRIEMRPMPRVDLIDMRVEFLETRKQNTFSRELLTAIGERIHSGEQVMLLHNRRGFSSFVACRACGERRQCVNCAVTLTFHRRDRRMLCHYCGHAEKVPTACPQCQSDHIQFIGTGSEKVEEELHREFPEAKIARLDRDTVSGKRHFETILAGFREGNFDILVGTQMIAKGHDIANVTLVGVVSADIGLGMPDFRAAERTFQLLTQVAGRAGRGNIPGRVLVQTINPDHYAVRLAALQDFQAFYEKELQFRKLMRYPPFSALANILVRSEKQEDALRMSGELGNLLTPAPPEVKIMGPAEAPVSRIQAEFRYQILIKSASRKRLNETLQQIRRYGLERKWSATAIVIDVDPFSLL
ncbi:MAG TPA: primosomal protein N' [Bryobacteraceae bacterium]|nr:primosomal protein N' [Bryobacteraceae bacterium]